jgi:hypothetical protein
MVTAGRRTLTTCRLIYTPLVIFKCADGNYVLAQITRMGIHSNFKPSRFARIELYGPDVDLYAVLTVRFRIVGVGLNSKIQYE